jgi:hypothetical protein
MSPSNEDKLILLLTEIRSDIRQMKSDLQSLLRFLRQQQEKPSPPPPSISDDTPNDVERRARPKTFFVICGTRGQDDAGE